ncbi:type VI secretion system-associated protein TagF [Devosia sp. Root635]|uniref:type VI secretion system-associated protein TagF n=1 Tax=Devosia sp. Root635 TaxID=1736575 RepID=UPI0006FF20AC|nr:type VI secretion system-associated protein TagF [Devosia sp. Root635]KRA53068.1 hypothetical protein ASD80_13830 [Devosia sp. Root635]
MGFGFFGKVPQKGDYLALNLPPAVLGPVETWLAAALAASRAELGPAWQDHYLVAPIWRFWLPPSALGLGCAGSIMSSVDIGGRYFPATIIYVASKARALAPPQEWDSAGWYHAIDQRLLTILAAQDDTYLPNLLQGLPPPAAFDSSETRSHWWRGTPDTEGFATFQADGLPPPARYARMLAGP